MKPVITLIFFCLFVLTACSQSDTAARHVPEIREQVLPVGQSTITLRQLIFETEPLFLLLHLHSDEATGNNVAEALARREGLPFLQILNNGKREIFFSFGTQNFRFDPNRIFSNEGIRKTLVPLDRQTDAAIAEVQRFRDSLLSFIDSTRPVVAVHNNTDGRFNVWQYKDVAGAQLFVNEAHDSDDFFITNDADLFTLIKTANFSVVLENAALMEDDGSLSLYCARKKIRYINVEAQHGHSQQQAEMLNIVRAIFRQ